MKRLTSFLILIFTLATLSAQREVSPDILNALSRGDAAGLSAFFSDNVELVIGGTNDVFSKQQATGIVTDFFRRNKVSGFQVLHRGAKDNSAFSIATMTAGNGTFRVYVLVRRTASDQLIQQLRIESSNE